MSADISIDVCGLEPPEPLVRVLDALSRLADGNRLHLRIDREPKPLYRILESNGYRYTPTLRPDYQYDIEIWKQV